MASSGSIDQLFHTKPVSCATAIGTTTAICSATPCKSPTTRDFLLRTTIAIVGIPATTRNATRVIEITVAEYQKKDPRPEGEGLK